MAFGGRRILLLNPAESTPAWPTMPRAVEPMGLLYVAGAFAACGVEVAIVDLQLEHGDLEAARRELAEGHFAGVGIALASQACLWSGLALAQEARNAGPEVPIFAGGVFATLNAEWLLQTSPCLDAVVVGEGEPFAQRFVSSGGRLEGPYAHTRSAGAPPALPVSQSSVHWTPDRSLTAAVVARGEAPSVVATRGCRGGCSFCCVSRYYGPAWLPRPVADVRDEIVALARTFRSARIHVVDDNLFGHGPRSSDWVRELVAALAAVPGRPGLKTTCRVDDLEPDRIERLAGAGVELLKIGIETLCERTQGFYGKRFDRDRAAAVLERVAQAGIDVSLGFIMFDPFCTIGDLATNLDFLLQRPRTWSRHLLRSRLVAYRRTRIEERLQRMGLVTRTGISGSQWRFEDDSVARVHAVFERLLRAHVLPVERALYDLQRAALSGARRPPAPARVADALRDAWVALLRGALDGREHASRRALEHVREAEALLAAQAPRRAP